MAFPGAPPILIWYLVSLLNSFGVNEEEKPTLEIIHVLGNWNPI